MKKLLKLLSGFIFLGSPILLTTEVVSCSSLEKVYTPQKISVDTNRVFINVGDDNYFTILNNNNLKNVKVSIDDAEVCSQSSIDGKITIKALTEGSANLVISADNAIEPITVKVNTYSSTTDLLTELKTITDFLRNILPDFSESGDYAKFVADFLANNNFIISSLAALTSGYLSKITLNPEIATFIAHEVNLSKYEGLTYQKVLSISNARIASGILAITKGDDYSKTAINADFTSSDFLTTTLADFSTTISSLINPSKSNETQAKTSLSPTTIIFAAGEILNGFLGVISYINNFDLSKDVSWDTVENVYANKWDNSKNSLISLSVTANNIQEALASKEGLLKIMRILFSQNKYSGKSNDAAFDGIAINLVDNKELSGINYAAYGVTPIVQAFTYGAINNNTTFDGIASKLSILVSEDKLKFALANGITNILSFMANGWNYKAIYVKASVVFFTKTLSLPDLLTTAQTLGILTAEEATEITPILQHPVSYIYNALPKSNGLISIDFTLANLVDFLKIDIDKNKVLGKWQDLKVTDFVVLVCDTLKNSSTVINFAYINSFVLSLLQPISSGQKVVVLQYLLSNFNEISSPDSQLWKYLGLIKVNNAYTIKSSTPLDYLQKLATSKGGIKAIIIDINDILNKLLANS